MKVKQTILAAIVLLSAINTIEPAKAENWQHIQQLLSTKDCQQCDLKGTGLFMADLVGAQLSGADLSRANLSRANLSGADLSGANLSGTSLNGANLSGANLSGANLSGTDLRDAFLVEAKLFGVSLDTAYVQGAIGIPQYAGTPEDFYAWGVVEARKGNYKVAIENFDKVLNLKPEFAPAWLGRGVSRYRQGDEAGAIQDAEVASELFNEQGNTEGYQATQNLLQEIEIVRNPPEVQQGSSLGRALVSIGAVLFRVISLF
ncbi:pentapeptide repeat-containing protein [Lyngbya aestuarii]|uniref:pentapeptide repeat-containing protein n=1 Tax=Lyngbya aestuarii TaxID=118322 RepID=UPI00403E3368